MLRPYEGLLHICPYGNASTDDQFFLKTYLAASAQTLDDAGQQNATEGDPT